MRRPTILHNVNSYNSPLIHFLNYLCHHSLDPKDREEGMLLSDLIILGVIIAIIVVLIRVISGTPLIRRIAESFESGGSTNNSSTECPSGTTFYMHNGVAFCCSGTVDQTADTPLSSCRPRNTRDEVFTFCTLGGSQDDIPNCSTIRGSLMDLETAKFCPPGYHFATGGSKGSICCSSTVNSDRTDCLSSSDTFCSVSPDENWWNSPNSCQFLKAKADAGACPPGFGSFTASSALPQQTGGSSSPITLFGCTDNGQNCYASSTLQRLREMGYDTTGLNEC